MTLEFPNTCRSYDATRHSVHFWGYDGVFEILFHVTYDVLCVIAPDAGDDEAGILESFDSNRSRIIRAAAKAYLRGRQGSYSLAESDF